ncbi:hypothetical protein E8E13_000288 [Curvularia kusanoi]|uniref:Chitin-binding type-1 domain-containing protein n=1 Tax=Curvularia kusanoi TaxID=90978 RepID=A0A9P4T3K8_CURKU|nr:hypothetical protein E8E13_000288 [Curvularia kusanoi]
MLPKPIVALGLLQLVAASSVSKDARCGREFGGQTCQGSIWGNCCSRYGYCGRTEDYCNVAKMCQSNFGTCNGQYPANPTTMKTTATKQNTGLPQSLCTTATVTKDPVTVTKVGSTITKFSSTTTTVTKDPITITRDSPIVTKPEVTVTGSGITITVTLPGEDVTITVPVTQTQAASTISLPPLTVTLPAVTIPAETVTATLPASTVTLPAVTESLPAVTLPAVTETLPAVTKTLPAIIETLPAVTETLSAVTETLPATTVTLPADTVTETVTQTTAASCPTGNSIINGGFDNPLPGTWVALTSGDADVSRVAVAGGFAARGRINTSNANLPQRIEQAVSICSGVNYQVGFLARRTTSAGTVSAVLYVDDTPLAGGTVTSTAFTTVASVNGGTFLSVRNTALVRIEFTYSGGFGSAKEVQIDDVFLTPV